MPLTFTNEDFDQAVAGNLVVKVIYLPDRDNQDFASIAGAEELVSTRLEPGDDPVAEAQRRGTILAIVRLGNIDLENRASPAMNAPPPGGPMMLPPGAMPPGMIPGIPPGPGRCRPGRCRVPSAVGLRRPKPPPTSRSADIPAVVHQVIRVGFATEHTSPRITRSVGFSSNRGSRCASDSFAHGAR